MLFFMQEGTDNSIVGWILPENPSALPRIKIAGPNGFFAELEANAPQLDLRDKGHHETGFVGFHIDEKTLPGFSSIQNEIEIRESSTNVLIYRKFLPQFHVETKLFRFELRAMPDSVTEGLFARHFALYYGAVQRHPQDTFFGVFNNPSARSIYLSGCPNYQQYEQLLKEREYKIIALLRNPYEEMAERLLFARYALTPNIPTFVADHMFGIEPLMDMVKDIRFDNIDSIRAAFNSMTETQKEILSNPLVRALACNNDERPKSGHVEIALSKLSRMDLVGLRSRFGEFKSILPEIIGRDIFEGHELTSLAWVQRIVEQLSQIKQARALITLDLDLYSFIEEAITEAIGPAGPAS